MTKRDPSSSDNPAGGWSKSKFVVGPIVAALTAIFIAIVTPLGERLVEFIFPTSAVVEGFVQKEGKPVQMIRLLMDDETFATTTHSGRFLFRDVHRGFHSLKVLTTNEQLLFYDEFFIKKGEDEKKLEVIELAKVPVAKKTKNTDYLASNPSFVVERKQPDFEISLMHDVTVIPLAERRPGFESNTREVTVWTQAADDVLSQIDRVTYYLHPTFNPSVVTRYSPMDEFALSFTAWGQFEIKAKVYFKDGQVKDLSRYLSFETESYTRN